jgi:hypothetical protein
LVFVNQAHAFAAIVIQFLLELHDEMGLLHDLEHHVALLLCQGVVLGLLSVHFLADEVLVEPVDGFGQHLPQVVEFAQVGAGGVLLERFLADLAVVEGEHRSRLLYN